MFKVRPPERGVRFARYQEEFSPDYQYTACVEDYNLYLRDLKKDTTTALTTDGHEDLRNGYPDWVYAEEFAQFYCFWWSPDSKKIAYMQFDESPVRKFPLLHSENILPTPSALLTAPQPSVSTKETAHSSRSWEGPSSRKNTRHSASFLPSTSSSNPGTATSRPWLSSAFLSSTSTTAGCKKKSFRYFIDFFKLLSQVLNHPDFHFQLTDGKRHLLSIRVNAKDIRPVF